MKINLYDICILLEKSRQPECTLFSTTTRSSVCFSTGIKLPFSLYSTLDQLHFKKTLSPIIISVTKPKRGQFRTYILEVAERHTQYTLYRFGHVDQVFSVDLCHDNLLEIFKQIPQTIYISVPTTKETTNGSTI